jgi:hypothetical protein
MKNGGLFNRHIPFKPHHDVPAVYNANKRCEIA